LSEEKKKALPNLLDEKAKLEKRIADLEEEKRLALINEIIDLWIEFGSTKAEDRELKVERLKKLDDFNLTVLRDEFQRMVDVVAKKRNLSHRLYR